MIQNQLNYLRIRIGSSTYALCLVPNGSGNPNMGGIPHVRRSGTTYYIYLVPTTNAFASPARMQTSGGTKAFRLSRNFDFSSVAIRSSNRFLE